MECLYQGPKSDEVKAVLADVAGTFCRHIGQNMKGLYLHGSLAMGCFRPWSSDIDLLAVVFEPMDRETKLRLVGDVIAVAEGGGEFRSIEFSIVTAEQAAYAAHPIDYILHYSSGWHQSFKEGRADLVIEGGPDEDLAAHFMVTSERGITLAGAPIAETFGTVSRVDYLKAVWYDIANAEQEALKNPVYTVLNLCRTMMYLETGRVGSKLEGGRWAAGRNEFAPYLPLIDQASQEYKTGRRGQYDAGELSGFARSFSGHISRMMQGSLDQ